MAKNLNAMVLAAGYGTRLLPFTKHLPKPLFPILGRPIIWYQCGLLLESGVETIVVNVHHLSGLLEKYFSEGSLENVKPVISHEAEILGTGGGVKKAQSYLSDGVSIVINGDTLLDVDLPLLIDRHEKNGAEASLLVSLSSDVPDEHAVFIDETGRIKRIVGHGAPVDNSLTRCTFMGVHVLNPGVFDFLPDNGCIIRNCYTHMLDRGLILKGELLPSRFDDIGTPGALLKANSNMLSSGGNFIYRKFAGHNKCLNGGMLSKQVDGKINFLGAGVSVDPGALIGPGVVLEGQNIIGAGANISRSLVLKNENIKPGETVENSIAGFGYRVTAV